MKKVLSLVLAVMMLAAVLCACGDTTPTTTGKPAGSTPVASTPAGSTPVASTPVGSTGNGNTNNGPVVINVADYLADDSKWEFDSPDLADLKDGKLRYDTAWAGDFLAARLTETAQNATWKFTITVNEQPEDIDDSIWWDTELMIIARSTIAGGTWYDDLSQAGYTISAWGDLSEFCLGRCGYDDAFGTFQWNIADGQPHEIEFTTINSEDNKSVEIIVVVDGVEVARATDDGSKIKNERPALYPDEGGLTIRAKWMEITIE